MKRTVSLKELYQDRADDNRADQRYSRVEQTNIRAEYSRIWRITERELLSTTSFNE